MHSINDYITYVFAEEVLLLFEQVMCPVRELDGDTLIVQVTGKSHFCCSCSTKMTTGQNSQSQIFRTIPFHKEQAKLFFFRNWQQWE